MNIFEKLIDFFTVSRDRREEIAASFDEDELKIQGTIKEAEGVLFQSNSIEYQTGLYDELLASEAKTLRVLGQRGWQIGNVRKDELNRFLVLLLGQIYKQGTPSEKEKVCDLFTEAYTIPDTHTASFTDLLTGAAKVIQNNNIEEMKPRLEALKEKQKGMNLRAIEYTLSLICD